MELGAILIGLAIFIVAFTYVINPMVSIPRKQPVYAVHHIKTEGNQQKDVLVAIRDLDFDFQTAKLNEEDYEALRAQLVLEAADYLQQKTKDEKIDEMIRARLLSKKESAFQVAGRIFCSNCGKSVKEGDLFCATCGARINTRSTADNISDEN
jgi:hypothetical protein